MTNMPDYKLYEVTWMDAWHSGVRYYHEGDDYAPLICKDVGYVVEENDETIVMASSISDDGSPRHINVLPWKFILHMEELV